MSVSEQRDIDRESQTDAPGVDDGLIPRGSSVDADHGVVFPGRVQEACEGLLEGVRCDLDGGCPCVVAGLEDGDALEERREAVLGVVCEAVAHVDRGAVGCVAWELLDDGGLWSACALVEDGLWEGVRAHFHGVEP